MVPNKKIIYNNNNRTHRSTTYSLNDKLNIIRRHSAVNER